MRPPQTRDAKRLTRAEGARHVGKGKRNGAGLQWQAWPAVAEIRSNPRPSLIVSVQSSGKYTHAGRVTYIRCQATSQCYTYAAAGDSYAPSGRLAPLGHDQGRGRGTGKGIAKSLCRMCASPKPPQLHSHTATPLTTPSLKREINWTHLFLDDAHHTLHPRTSAPEPGNRNCHEPPFRGKCALTNPIQTSTRRWLHLGLVGPLIANSSFCVM